MRRKTISSTIIAPVLAVICIAGCAVGPDYIRPSTSVPDSFLQAGADKEDFTKGEMAVDSWWASFKDAQLATLIEQAVLANNDLEGALARVNQARASRREAFLDLFPTITAAGKYARTHIPTSTFAGGSFRNGNSHITNEYYSSGFDAFWELDIFGRVRRGIEAKGAESAASVATLQDAIRILVSEVARTYVQLRSVQQQLSVAEQNANTQEKVVSIAKALFKGGQSTEFDVVRAKAQLANTHASIPRLQAQVQAFLYRLAVLCGKQPSEIEPQLAMSANIPKYQGPITIGDPAGLLQRRPDIRAAEMRLAAATASIGLVKGNLFPKVTFNGSISLQAPTVEALTSGDNDSYSILPTISWPAFNIGRVLAQVDQAESAQKEALAQYEQAVLLALEDTENALTQFSTNKRKRDYLSESVKNSAKAVEIARLQYENGLIDLLPVLDAQRVALLSEIELVQSEAEVASSVIAVFKALGGGWDEAVVLGTQRKIEPPNEAGN